MHDESGFPGMQPGNVPTPMVYLDHTPEWGYKTLVRNLRTEKAPADDELNALGKDGWELAGILSDLPFVYFYFKKIK